MNLNSDFSAAAKLFAAAFCLQMLLQFKAETCIVQMYLILHKEAPEAALGAAERMNRMNFFEYREYMKKNTTALFTGLDETCRRRAPMRQMLRDALNGKRTMEELKTAAGELEVPLYRLARKVVARLKLFG